MTEAVLGDDAAPVGGELSYEVVDVFTDAPFTGNPLAVVLGADDLADEALLAIAREFHLSETCFPMAPSEQEAASGADYRLRIFTPSVELPFAGHPSVGAAWVMARLGRVQPGAVVQSCGAGLLPLLVEPDGGTVTLTGGRPTYGPELLSQQIVTAAGLLPQDLVGAVRIAGCGLSFGYLQVRRSALERVELDVAALRRAMPGARGFTGLCVFAWVDGTAYARVYAYDAGVAEDPATGSAALGLGVYLVAAELLPGEGASSYEVVQGVEMGRPSRLLCTIDAAGGEAVTATVTGSVVPVATGTIRRP